METMPASYLHIVFFLYFTKAPYTDVYLYMETKFKLTCFLGRTTYWN